MRIAIAGYKGFIGGNMKEYFSSNELVLLRRDEVYGRTEDLAKKLEKVDVVLNFAGYPVLKRWSGKNRKRIEDSRILFTKKLVYAINTMEQPPGQFVCASAIGIYSYGECHDEKSQKYGSGFLASVVQRWESSLKDLKPGVVVSIIRIGLVTGNDGGAFPRLKKLTKWGLGAILGSGKQFYSFVHIEDLMRGVDFIISHQLEGVFNLTTSNPVTNETFTGKLATMMHRPLIFWIPGFVMRLVYGESAQILIQGHKVLPVALKEKGFTFTFENIEEVYRDLLRE